MHSLPILNVPSPIGAEAAGREYVVVVGVTAQQKVAWVRSAEPGREWELPGGAMRPGESTLEAAAREFGEETGWRLEGAVDAAQIRNLVEGGHREHSRAHVVAGSIVAESDPGSGPDSSISERALMSAVPVDSTFDRDWMAQLVQIGLERVGSRDNHALWSKAAAQYDEQTEISESEVHYGPLLPGESALKLLPEIEGSRVLDLGCGAGHNLRALQHAGAASGLGIDFSGEQIRRARERLHDSRFELVNDDVTKFAFEQRGPFDLAISVFSIAFVPQPAGLLRRVADCLAPGGVLIISTDHPCRIGAWRDGALHVTDWYADRTRRRLWEAPGAESVPFLHYVHDLSSLIGGIARAGLSIESLHEPPALAIPDLDRAPYRAPYYVARHEELARIPYTMILKARRGR